MRGSLLLMLVPALACAQSLTPAWVELGEGGQAQVRVVVSSPRECPAIQIDGSAHLMKLREPVPEGLRPVCEWTLRASARAAAVNGQALFLPRRNPRKVVVIGDTGCRIKGARVQDCNDPQQWPFAEVSAIAASEQAELIIHVGDYLYRESPCPIDAQTKCGGSPAGDNWEAWNADFFAPAGKLLAAAPWAFSRGNHEDCQRSWRGWFYYLDPRSFAGTCEEYSPAYLIRLGAFELVMFDSSAAEDTKVEPKQVAEYAAQLSSLHAKNAWLADHHPFFGLKTGTRGVEAQPLSIPLAQAWDRAQPKGIHTVISGHVHLFEVLSYQGRHPLQIVAGDGGTDLADPLPATLNGIPVDGVKIEASESQRQFGYTVLSRKSRKAHHWQLTLQNRKHEVLLSCAITGETAACAAKP